MMYRASGLNAHTLYAHYARLREKSIEEILRLRKYLFPEENTSINEIGQYLTRVVLRQAPLQLQIQHLLGQSGKDQDVVNDLILRLDSYIRRYDRAVAGFQESIPHLNILENDNEVFRSTVGKHNECLYVLDVETCSQLHRQEKFLSPDGRCVFSGKSVIELTGHQTDAVRVWSDNTELAGLGVLDHRSYGNDKAHWCGIQLIPAPEYELSENGEQILFKRAGQLACTLLNNVTIRDCEIRAENGPLQGVVASDGLHRNLKIHGNTVATRGSHAITIAGLLTGGEFRANTLRQLEGGRKPAITLYPARIGRNMADDGVINILSFKADSEFKYGPFAESDNRLQYRGETTVLKVKDLRGSVPEMYVNFALGLHHFDYQAYRSEYSAWTVRDFKARDPEGYELMHNWIILREWEYRHGKREAGSLLPSPSMEQRALGANTVLGMLTKARVAIQTGHRGFYATRLADLPHTPVRSFVMKRIAIRHGVIAPLQDLGLNNDSRKANLEFLLPGMVTARVVEGVV